MISRPFCHSSSQGHDTTAAASSFFLSMMGCHPDIQEKVIQELDDIFGDSDRLVTFQDTLEMKYLERCLMETLRMYPPVPIIARTINTDLKLGEFSKPRYPRAANLMSSSSNFNIREISIAQLVRHVNITCYVNITTR